MPARSIRLPERNFVHQGHIVQRRRIDSGGHNYNLPVAWQEHAEGRRLGSKICGIGQNATRREVHKNRIRGGPAAKTGLWADAVDMNPERVSVATYTSPVGVTAKNIGLTPTSEAVGATPLDTL